MRAGRGKDFPRRSLTLGSLGTSAGAVPSLSLKCLIIAPGGTGVFDPVSGIGTGLIDWGAATSGHSSPRFHFALIRWNIPQ